MQLLDRVMHQLVAHLVRDGLLELAPGATVDSVADDLLRRVREAPNHAHIGAVLSDALIEMAAVEELYADDHELVDRLNHFYG